MAQTSMELAKILGPALFLALVGYFFWNDWKKKNGGSAGTDSDLTTDLTAKARSGDLEPIVGMDEAIERVLHVIARKQKNNPLLLGEPGVGKTAVVEGLAQRIASGEVPDAFKDKRVLSLNITDLLSGTKYRGELESRLRGLLRSLESEKRNTILFIDELHMIEQARGSEGSVDIADILKPALSRGDLQVIGATTWREYEKYLKPDAAIDRRFQPVLVEEPSRETAIAILSGIKHRYEEFHGVCIPPETIEAAVDASIRFIHERNLPDKAFDVIDEACAKVAINGPTKHACAFGLVHAASANAKARCEEGHSLVTPEDVEEIARQWTTHRAKRR